MNDFKKYDFQMLMLKLQNSKVTVSEIRLATGMCWQQQGRIRRGESQGPKFNAGIQLLDLAYDELGEEVLRECQL